MKDSNLLGEGRRSGYYNFFRDREKIVRDCSAYNSDKTKQVCKKCSCDKILELQPARNRGIRL